MSERKRTRNCTVSDDGTGDTILVDGERYRRADLPPEGYVETWAVTDDITIFAEHLDPDLPGHDPQRECIEAAREMNGDGETDEWRVVRIYTPTEEGGEG